MNPGDTIVAISSAVGLAARIIVRLDGPNALALFEQLSPAAINAPAQRTLLHFADLTCPAWAYMFVNPHSYTGNDAVELQIPGNPLLARLLVEHLTASGARMAEPGEFTARAFFNGRLDLAAAEGVAMTIAATHADELRAARQLLAGELAKRLSAPLESLTEALALLESNIDFSEDDIAFIDSDEVHRRLLAATTALDDLTANAARFDRMTGEPTFVLVGLPNAGKSTLLNALAGSERAVVSPVAGTTRDALSAEVALPRGIVRVIDVAGFERAGDDAISRQMQERARRTIEEADFVIEARDGTSDAKCWLPRQADLIVRTKADLRVPLPLREGVGGGVHCAAEGAAAAPSSQTPHPSPLPQGERGPDLTVSATTGFAIDDLVQRLDDLAFGRSSGGHSLALTARHLAAVDEAKHALALANDAGDSPELVADAVRRAVDAIGQILGRVTPDDVLSRVFATFCVGK
ncbi:MAG: 50S ribosome-binding GTPase [Tepidisphaeraceae bacterium]